MSGTHPWLRRLLGGLLVGAAVVFLGREILGNLEQLRTFEWSVRPGLLLLSTIALSGVLFWGVVVWRMVIGCFGIAVPLRGLARAWFLANLSRYVPGVVWQFVSLAQLGSGMGLPATASVLTLLTFVGFSLLAATVLGVWLLPAEYAGALGGLVLALRWLSPVALLLVHPAVIRGMLNLVARLTRRSPMTWSASWFRGLQLLAVSAFSWVLYGLAFHLFLLAFVDLDATAVGAVIAINAIAFVVGYLVVVAPGGLGFKEAAITLLLAGLVPTAVAASLAIASRLWTIAAELAPALYLAARHTQVTPSPPDAS